MELRPQRAPAGVGVGDAGDEALDERDVRVEQGEAVVLLDQEQRVHAAGDRVVDQRADLGAGRSEPLQPRAQQGDDVVGVERPDQRERRDEVGVLVLRLGHQLAEPRVQLGTAGVRDRVRRPLGPLARAAALLLSDQPAAGQLLEHHVERTVREADAPRVAVGLQRAAELVRVHGLPREVREHAEGEHVPA